MPRSHLGVRALFIALLFFLLPYYSSPSSDHAEYAYSLSMSSFNPEGRLIQLDYAQIGANKGTPVLAFRTRSRVKILAPLELPNKYCEDSVVSKITQISPDIIASFTGIPADYSYIITAARTVVQKWRDAYDEDIGAEAFVKAVSEVFQENTLNGCRVFGCKIIVAAVTPQNTTAIYTIDPGGGVAILTASSDTAVSRIGDWGDGGADVEATKDMTEERAMSMLRGVMDRRLDKLKSADELDETVCKRVLVGTLSTNCGKAVGGSIRSVEYK
jgi:20S proteasome alpha/beta subunit